MLGDIGCRPFEFSEREGTGGTAELDGDPIGIAGIDGAAPLVVDLDNGQSVPLPPVAAGVEVLDGGRYGGLVPVGDPTALGKAMLSALKSSANREELKLRGRVFSVATCAAAYVTLIRQLMLSPARNSDTQSQRLKLG